MYHNKKVLLNILIKKIYKLNINIIKLLLQEYLNNVLEIYLLV
jgi:hypothetical protein